MKERTSSLNNIVAVKTNVSSLDYRTVTSSTALHSLSELESNSYIPRTDISTRENLVPLRKRGRMLTASYEALRFQRLDLFSTILRQIGACIAYCQLGDAIKVLFDGDGNSNPAEVIPSTGEGLRRDLLELCSFYVYNANTLITSSSEVADKVTFHIQAVEDNNVADIVRTTLVRFPELGSKVIALDKNYALEMVTAGDIQVDFDSLINRQFERVVISQVVGFAKIFDEAVKVLDISRYC